MRWICYDYNYVAPFRQRAVVTIKRLAFANKLAGSPFLVTPTS